MKIENGKLIGKSFPPPSPKTTPGSPINVSLSIVREQGSSGNVAVRLQTRPALSQPPANQASAGLDYLARDATVVMVDGATVVLVTFTIMPVNTEFSAVLRS